MLNIIQTLSFLDSLLPYWKVILEFQSLWQIYKVGMNILFISWTIISTQFLGLTTYQLQKILKSRENLIIRFPSLLNSQEDKNLSTVFWQQQQQPQQQKKKYTMQ